MFSTTYQTEGRDRKNHVGSTREIRNVFVKWNLKIKYYDNFANIIEIYNKLKKKWEIAFKNSFKILEEKVINSLI